MTTKRVTVIVPVYNDRPGIERCLDALALQVGVDDGFEVLVADNGSLPPLPDYASRHRFARTIAEPRPGSYAARNAAWRQAGGTILAFTDADCRPDPHWLAAAIAHLDANPATDAVGGAIVLELSARPSAAELYERVFSFRMHKTVAEAGFAFTANLVVRRAAFERVGAFDDTLRSGGDREWGQRLHVQGGRMDYVDAARVVHPARATMRELIHKRRRLEGGRARVPGIGALKRDWVGKPAPGVPRGAAMGLELLLRPSRLGLAGFDGVRVLAVAGLLTAVGLVERVRLRLGGTPLR